MLSSNTGAQMPRKFPPGSLYLKTLRLLQNRNVKVELKQIADDTGLNKAWLSNFNLEKTNDPSVNFVQVLYEYLTKSKLEV